MTAPATSGSRTSSCSSTWCTSSRSPNCQAFILIALGESIVVPVVPVVDGWWQWLHGGQARARLTVARSGWQLLAACVFFVAAATWGLTLLLGAAHDIAPFWDALTTALSLAAQFLLNCKRIENWGFWVAADVVYIPLYTVKRLDLTAIVYVLFLAMCFAGVAAWRRALRAGRQAAARTAATTVMGGTA